MNRSTILQRLVLLTAIPLVALLIFSAALISNSFGLYKNAGQTRELMQVSVAAGDLIHALQKERGTTAGYLQSNGQKMADSLPGLRSKTDEQLKAYKALAESIQGAATPDALAAFKRVDAKLAEMGELRTRAWALSVPVGESIGFYTSTITALLDTMDGLARLNRDPSIAKQFQAYQAVIRGKENAGQERAMTTAAFAANKVEAAQYRAILQKRHKQEAYQEVFNGAADPAQKAALQKILGGNAEKEVQRLRAVLDAGPVQGSFNVEPADWFKAISEKIDELHALELATAAQINASASELLADSRALLLWQLALTLLAIGLSAAVAAAVAQSVNRPLKEVIEAAAYAIEHDDFTRNVPEVGTVETARVGQMNNRLMEKFRSIIFDTTRASSNIADSANTLSVASVQVKTSSAEQADAVSSIAATFEEVSVSVSETASNMQTVGQIASEQAANVTGALDLMGKLVNNVQGITDVIRSADASALQLDSSSKKIGGIVQVIKGLAEQTNLLALNAAIEAARAGEQGRGFAVVADEVRKLAESTAASTAEIGNVIKEIQSQVDRTVSGMRQASEQVSDSMTLAGKTETALHAIGEGSRDVTAHVTTVADAIREQDAAIQNIAGSLEKNARMAGENSTASESSSSTAQRLDELAEALKRSVDRYKVDQLGTEMPLAA